MAAHNGKLYRAANIHEVLTECLLIQGLSRQAELKDANALLENLHFCIDIMFVCCRYISTADKDKYHHR
jgi:hypothetical protein